MYKRSTIAVNILRRHYTTHILYDRVRDWSNSSHSRLTEFDVK